MPIQLSESPSTRKRIDVTVTPATTGIHVLGAVEWYAGGRAERYEIDVDVPCVYTDDARYRVALCTTTPRLVLVEDDGQPADELCYLARWNFTKATDTCANVVIDVPRRVLVPEPTTVETLEDGTTVEHPPEPLPTPAVHVVTGCDLPIATPEQTESRKVRRRIRDLRVQCKALRDAGKTFAQMTAAERLVPLELSILTGEPVGIAVP